jgi:type III secretion protein T
MPSTILEIFTPMRVFGETLEDVIGVVALCSIRLYAAFAILPATGEQFMTGLIRGGFVITIGIYIALGMPLIHAETFTLSQWLVLIAKEGLIGLILGFCASTIFWIAECVGALIDTQTGYNNAQLSNPMTGQQSTPISGLLLQMITAVYFSLGGMIIFIQILFESFKIWPLMAALPSLAGVAEVFFVQEADGIMSSVVKFAAPVLLILVLVDLGLGLITRSADKLEPNSLSQPIKGALTMLLLALLVGIFVDQIRRFLIPIDLMLRLRSLFPVG